jgi:hypothetical protein
MRTRGFGFKEFLIAVTAFFLFISFGIYGLSTGNPWILFGLLVLIALAIVPTKIKGLIVLVILLLVVWFSFFGAGDSLKRNVGDKLSDSVKQAAKQNIDNKAQNTVPGLANQISQQSRQLDQKDLNACLRVKAADAMRDNPGLKISEKEAPCLTQTGVAFEECMRKNVFNGNVPGEVEDCEPSGLDKLGNLALSTAYVGAKSAVGGACSATKFVNAHVPGVNLPTNYCPPA